MGGQYTKRIPTELESEILQHIADEDEHHSSRWSALSNCALVCKAWTKGAQRHLYYTINMNKLRGSLQFESLRRYAHLRPFVRDFKWPRMESEDSSLYCFNASDADLIKEIAPAVMKLRFRRVDHCSLKPPLKEVIPTFANIKELDMTESIFEDWTTVIRIISSFPFLTTLAMPRTAAAQDDGPKISYPPPSRLVNIKLAFDCAAETVNWICTGSPISNIQTVEAEDQIDSNVLARLLRSLGGSLRHLTIHTDSGFRGLYLIKEASASCYRLTENTTLETIKVICSWTQAFRKVIRSVITNLIGSICSPHLRSVNLMLVSMVEEVEHFPWEVVNNLTKTSPHMLQRVDVSLRLLGDAEMAGIHWGHRYLSPDEYAPYFRQVRSALPELDKKMILSVASHADSFDARSSCDIAYPSPGAYDTADEDDDTADEDYDAYDAYDDYSPESDDYDVYG